MCAVPTGLGIAVTAALDLGLTKVATVGITICVTQSPKATGVVGVEGGGGAQVQKCSKLSCCQYLHNTSANATHLITYLHKHLFIL